ncbi:inner membrane mitochondrial protein mitofilin isoform X3 [Oratosquilla oratoria]|uniref:inner membrane mitochondrial protein mitofilin isoform X3 n=1 Tax=Oratosquilla oratoria TaxID=337810 RepID=UPI003F76FBDE
MLRIPSKLTPRITSKVVQRSSRRLQSTRASGGGPGKALIAAGGVVVSVGGVIAYSSWSPDNRKSVENTIPGSKHLLGAILGSPVESPKTTSSSPPITKTPEHGLLRKKLERERKRKEEEKRLAAEKEAQEKDLEEKAPEPAPVVPVDAPASETVEDKAPVVEEGTEVVGEILKEEAPAEPQSSVDENLSDEKDQLPAPTDKTSEGGAPADKKPEEEAATVQQENAVKKPEEEAPKFQIFKTEGKTESTPVIVYQETDKGDIEARLTENEINTGVENAALSQILEDCTTAAQKGITHALDAAENAAIAINNHAEKAFQAIDAGQDKELLFAAVAELAKARADLTKIAEEKITAAESAVEKLKAQIEEGLSSSITKGNKALLEAEETFVELKFAMDKIKSIVAEASRDGKVISDYKDLVETGRQQFENEVKSLLPEVTIGETSETLTKDELNLLIAHAHRRVMQLQNQLAKMQTLEHERFKEALLKQREEDNVILEAKIKASLCKQEQQLELEYKKKIKQLQDEMENDLRAQLKRQAAAHSDHLADVLRVQEKELDNKWSSLLKDEVLSEKTKYLAELGGMRGHLDGLKSAIVARADLDKAAHAGRELWIACEALRQALRVQSTGVSSVDEACRPLQEEVNAVTKAAGDSNPFVTSVLGAISTEAVNRGVYSEDSLKERFIKVERICKRVSMIGDNGGSLVRYLMSYIQSFLVLNAFEYVPGPEAKDEQIAVDSLSTYDILDRAKYCLDKDDLNHAVRYMNLLRGAPRHVAADWLKEARLLLEARQAADVLMAHAAAIAVKTL